MNTNDNARDNSIIVYIKNAHMAVCARIVSIFTILICVVDLISLQGIPNIYMIFHLVMHIIGFIFIMAVPDETQKIQTGDARTKNEKLSGIKYNPHTGEYSARVCIKGESMFYIGSIHDIRLIVPQLYELQPLYYCGRVVGMTSMFMIIYFIGQTVFYLLLFEMDTMYILVLIPLYVIICISFGVYTKKNKIFYALHRGTPLGRYNQQRAKIIA